jgi:peptide/nickel transport system permease protein
MRLLRDLWKICKRDKGALVGGAIMLVYLVIAVIGPYIVHVGVANNPANSYLTPSLRHPLGTDFEGNDVLALLIVGTRPVIEVGVLSALMVVTVGVIVGLASGYMGGAADNAVMRVTDVFLTIPGLPLIIVIASLVHSANPIILAGILSVTGWAGLARPVRSLALSLRSADFIDAARAQDLSLAHIVGRQLLPNVGPYVAIHFLLAVTGAIYAEVGLFLLGIAPISGQNWGIDINLEVTNGALYTSRSISSVMAPLAAIVILQVSLVFFARALDQLFNPRLRTASSR